MSSTTPVKVWSGDGPEPDGAHDLDSVSQTWFLDQSLVGAAELYALEVAGDLVHLGDETTVRVKVRDGFQRVWDYGVTVRVDLVTSVKPAKGGAT